MRQFAIVGALFTWGDGWLFAQKDGCVRPVLMAPLAKSGAERANLNNLQFQNDHFIRKNMITSVDTYFTSGCGRCPRFDTPDCKVHKWQRELEKLRAIVLDCGLTEEAKWGLPVYSFQKSNVVMIAAFNDHCVLSFFKGALLQDEHGILTFPGENSQSGKVIRFTEAGTIQQLEDTLKAYIFEAVEVEKAGLKVNFKKITELEITDELRAKFDEVPAFQAAFEALTPGRQRGYILYFSAAKQSATRTSRVEKYMQQIFEGKGLHD